MVEYCRLSFLVYPILLSLSENIQITSSLHMLDVPIGSYPNVMVIMVITSSPHYCSTVC